MRCYFIRHGETAGNGQLHFNGCRTDEPLTESGRAKLCRIDDVPGDALLFTSPMIRARETASIMLPQLGQRVIEGLKEMDFGRFEGKNHKMLDGDPEYQAWLDSGGSMRIPGGETLDEFGARAAGALMQAYKEASAQYASVMYIVAHGGTIMALMGLLTGEKYYEFNLPNGAGYVTELEETDAEYGLAATSYDRFCGGLRAGFDDWRPPRYTSSGDLGW